MAAGSSPSPQCLLALIILVLQWPKGAIAFQSTSLSSLLTNAVEQAQHLNLLARNTFKEFGQSHISEDQRNTIMNTACHTENLQTPLGKDEVLQKSDMELLRFSLNMLQSWMTSSCSLRSVNNPPFSSSDRVFEKLKDLEEGVWSIMKEMGEDHSQGVCRFMPGYENFDLSPNSDEDTMLKNYGLLSCFKTDMHKVLTFLTVTKCRVLEQSNC